jgi:hypothetical protein
VDSKNLNSQATNYESYYATVSSFLGFAYIETDIGASRKKTASTKPAEPNTASHGYRRL